MRNRVTLYMFIYFFLHVLSDVVNAAIFTKIAC